MSIPDLIATKSDHRPLALHIRGPTVVRSRQRKSREARAQTGWKLQDSSFPDQVEDSLGIGISTREIEDSSLLEGWHAWTDGGA
eukprot:10494149-Lingulodinium_polyedra.AAC.1